MSEVDRKPLVTVVVCTYNDETTIGTVMEAITRLTYEPIEILVINDASTDRTREIVERFPVVVLNNSKNRGLGYNQNLGLKMARGDYLALIQSDCEVQGEDWLDRMMEIMQEDVAVVVSQRRISDFASLPTGARLFNAVAPQDLLNSAGEPLEQRYCRGKSDVYRTSVLREVDGWNPAFFTAGEDTDLSIRLRQRGFRILLHPEAAVRYLFSGRQVSVSGALRKAFLYGRMACPLYRLHRYDGIQARTYMTLILSGAAMLLPPTGCAVAGAMLFLYAWTCRIQTSGGARRIPYGALALAAGILPALAWTLQGAPSPFSLPALSLVFAGLAYTGYLSAKNALRNQKKGDRWSAFPVTFLFCATWRLVSGAGYLVAAATRRFSRERT